MRYFLLISFLFIVACGPAMDANNMVRNSNSNGSTETAPTPDAELKAQIEEIAKEAKGKVGAYALLLETGESVSLNPNEQFAMQSVVKLPISMAVLKQVEDGNLHLEKHIGLEKADMVPSGMRSPIRDGNPEGTQVTIRGLLQAAISESDGTASDVLQKSAGDAKGVQAYIDSLGIGSIKVKYSHKEFYRDNKMQYENWASPEAAVALLAYLFEASGGTVSKARAGGHGISKANAEILLKFMTESNNPPNRIKGMLPKDARVAHKTGTSGTTNGVTAATNDIGIVGLPNGKYFAIAVFVGDSAADNKTREAIIARITKAVWDRWNK